MVQWNNFLFSEGFSLLLVVCVCIAQVSQVFVLMCIFIYQTLFSVGKEKLSKNIVSQKWDRLKLVCTQPYNKVQLCVCVSMCESYCSTYKYMSTIIL